MSGRHHRSLLIRGGGPSATYTTWDSSWLGPALGLTDGDLTVTHPGANAWQHTRSVHAKSAGKWYFEVVCDAFVAAGATMPGVVKATGPAVTSYHASNANGWGANNGTGTKYQKWNNGAATLLDAGWWLTGEICSVLLDLDAGELFMWDQGVAINGGAALYTGLSGTFYAALSAYGTGREYAANFGQNPFIYTPPAGYSGWTDITA